MVRAISCTWTSRNWADFGGQGLPKTIGAACGEILNSANLSFALCPLLTDGAIEALLTAGSDEQKRLYLDKMVAGQWTGTMNLTEPQCGTDLGLLRTKAVRQPDGSFKITGTKIFISAGEHDLAENIIHLVLARIEGAPAGIKGVSLFVVPKVLVNADGSLGQRNGVTCGSIEHKMGIHGNSTCVMNYDNATGWLIGEENKGMQGMFVMMNEARLGVAVQGLAQSEVAYQNAVAYARERLQSRGLSGAAAPEKAADPIIVHPDVRRMLLTMKALNEGGRAFSSYVALQLDIAKFSDDEAARQRAEAQVALLTPVAKAFSTDLANEVTSLGVQVHGGMGYSRHKPFEHIYRHHRRYRITEGSEEIQMRKVAGFLFGYMGANKR